MSGIGDPPDGGVSTVRGIGSRGFHSSTFTMTHTARRAPPGNASRGRSVIAEYAQRSLGSIVSLLAGSAAILRQEDAAASGDGQSRTEA